MRFYTRFILVNVLMVVIRTTVYAEDWRHVISKEGQFDIDFPTSDVKERDGAISALKGNATYGVGFAALENKRDPATVLDESSDALEKTMQTRSLKKLVDRKVKAGDFPGREFAFGIGNTVISRSRIIVAGRYVYVLQVVGPDSSAKDAERFFASFKIHTPTAREQPDSRVVSQDSRKANTAADKAAREQPDSRGASLVNSKNNDWPTSYSIPLDDGAQMFGAVFSPDNQNIGVIRWGEAAEARKIEVFDLMKKKKRTSISSGHIAEFQSMCFREDSKALATTSEIPGPRWVTQSWDLSDGAEHASLRKESVLLTEVLSYDSELGVRTCTRGDFSMRDRNHTRSPAETSRTNILMPIETQRFLLSRTGTLIAMTGSHFDSQRPSFWSDKDQRLIGQCDHFLLFSNNRIRVDFDDDIVALGDDLGGFGAWQTHPWKKLFYITNAHRQPNDNIGPGDSNDQPIVGVAVLKSKEIIITCGGTKVADRRRPPWEDGFLKLWSIPDGKMLRKLRIAGASVTGCLVSPNEKLIALSVLTKIGIGPNDPVGYSIEVMPVSSLLRVE